MFEPIYLSWLALQRAASSASDKKYGAYYNNEDYSTQAAETDYRYSDVWVISNYRDSTYSRLE